ncbi:MAG: type II toxin-antitoxin system prevent-host-death family antitoxin [Jatrophihabitans sp.]|nr:MAG: type II toxin-antitoxin system prevent-host-death family antitoxin [Jatrophihabitans sp.]
MTVEVNIYEAKTQLSKLIERAVAGERVIISKAGKPMVDLVPHQGSRLRFDTLAGQIEFDDDGFDTADAEIRAMYGPEWGLDDDPA